MRGDRIIIGECRGPEGSIYSEGHEHGARWQLDDGANDTRGPSRLKSSPAAGFELPIWVIRLQVASAIHIVVQVSRLLGGARKVVKISEVVGLEGDNFTMHDLFVFKQTGVDAALIAQGYFQGTGVRPNCMERLASFGVALPPQTFERRILN